jgi:NTE family protein
MKRLLVFIALSFTTLIGSAQIIDSILNEFDGVHRFPKIGLALSGGAAHGIAHVGVIKYLEELGIPVHYITGTSMGAIVGGLYSMGYDYDDLMDIVSSNDWDDIVSNRTRLGEVSPYEKNQHGRIPIKLRVEQSQFLLPKAIFDGHKLDLTIAELFSPANLIDSFDDLPRPFRCYTVDLLSGQVIEMDSGSLSQAVRASMAIPSVFTPVEKDSFLLVDGGLLKNFPVKENLSMGADIVIGVYVGSKRSKLEDVKSMLDILRLTGFIASYNDTEEQKLASHILIEPDVKDFPLLNFNIYQTLINKGYEAAKKDSVVLNKLASIFTPAQYEEKFVPLKLPQKFFIESVNIKNKETAYTELLKSRLKGIEKSQLPFSDIKKRIDECFATNNLYNINYSFSEGNLGQILNIDYSVQKESSIGISGNHFSTTNTSLIFQGTLRNIFTPLSNLTGFIRLSDNPGISGTYYKRYGKLKNYLGVLKLSVVRNVDPILINQEISKELIFNTFDIGAGIYKEVGGARLFGVEYGFRNRNIKPKVLQPDDLRELDQNLQYLTMSYHENDLDNWSYPNSGRFLKINSSFLSNVNQEASFTGDGINKLLLPEARTNITAQLVYRRYIPVNESILFSYIGSGGAFWRPSIADVYYVGGTDNLGEETLPFIGQDINELRMKEYLYARQSFRFTLSRNIYLSIIGNIIRGRTYNEAFIFGEDILKWKTTFGYGVSAGVHTVIGPINIDLGSTGGLDDLTFSVGVGYQLVK